MTAALRVFLAVVVGYLVMAALVVVSTMGLVAAFGLSNVSMPALPPARYLAAHLLSDMIAAGVGGYVCARLAPAGRVSATVGLMFAVFLVMGVLSGRAEASVTQPLWYQAVVTLLGAIGLLIGVVIQRSQDAGRAKRT